MSRSSRPITVTLGAYQQKVEAWVASGEYASASEVVRAGLRALEREEEALEGWIRDRVRTIAENPPATMSKEEAWRRLAEYQTSRAEPDAEAV